MLMRYLSRSGGGCDAADAARPPTGADGLALLLFLGCAAFSVAHLPDADDEGAGDE